MREEFLKELAELTKKYGIAIGGCGCCGSPYLYTVTDGHDVEDGSRLEYDEDKEMYICE